jgi:hypothetical protein
MDTQPRNHQALPTGTRVQVFSRFSESWVSGFEVATSLDGGYQLLRLSDKSVVPKTFPTEDLRPHHEHRW